MKNKQTIYYGPPGTGKTFLLKEKTVELIGVIDSAEAEILRPSDSAFNGTKILNALNSFYEAHPFLLVDEKYKPGKKCYRNLLALNQVMGLFAERNVDHLSKQQIITDTGWQGPSTYIQHARILTNFDLVTEDWNSAAATLTLNDQGKIHRDLYKEYLLMSTYDKGVLPISSKDYIRYSIINTTIGNISLWKNTIISALRLCLRKGYFFTYRNHATPTPDEKELINNSMGYEGDITFLGWVKAYLVNLDLVTESDDNDVRLRKYYLNKTGQSLLMSLNILEHGPSEEEVLHNDTENPRYILKAVFQNKVNKLKLEFNRLKRDNKVNMVSFHPSFSYEDFIEGITVNVDSTTGLEYKYKVGVLKQFATMALRNTLERYNEAINISSPEEVLNLPTENNWSAIYSVYKKNAQKIDWSFADTFVFIIDEINRGDLAKIFGETITLIETDKRLGANNELTVTLPYTGDMFGIPRNIYFLCTMNTSDRSIGLIDIALRRRFLFSSVKPDFSLIKQTYDVLPEDLPISQNWLFLSAMALEAINNLIIKVPYIGKDKLIGHSTLMVDAVMSNNDVFDAWQYVIIPMLEEYFYEQYEELLEIFKDECGDFISSESGFDKENVETLKKFIISLAKPATSPRAETEPSNPMER